MMEDLPIRKRCPKLVQSAILDYERRHGGKVTAAGLLKEVERIGKKHPIWKYITWDKDEASLQTRLREVRQLISVVVEQREDLLGGAPFKRYFNLRRGFRSAPEYYPVTVLMKRKNEREAVLQQAICSAEQWMARYRIYKELAKVIGGMGPPLKELKKKIK